MLPWVRIATRTYIARAIKLDYGGHHCVIGDVLLYLTSWNIQDFVVAMAMVEKFSSMFVSSLALRHR